MSYKYICAIKDISMPEIWRNSGLALATTWWDNLPMSKPAKRIAAPKHPFSGRVAQRAFVAQVMARKVTPEVVAFTQEATVRSHQVRTATFLEKFRKSVAISA